MADTIWELLMLRIKLFVKTNFRSPYDNLYSPRLIFL